MNDISSASVEHLPTTGYVLVPVNSITRAFLSQFALIDSTSGVVAPSSSVPNNVNIKNKNKKRNNDSNSSSRRPSKKNKLLSIGLAGNRGSSRRSSTPSVIPPKAGRSRDDEYGGDKKKQQQKLKKKSKLPSGPGSAGLAKIQGATVVAAAPPRRRRGCGSVVLCHGDHSGSFGGGGHHDAGMLGGKNKLKKKSKLPSGPGSAGLAKIQGATVVVGSFAAARGGGGDDGGLGGKTKKFKKKSKQEASSMAVVGSFAAPRGGVVLCHGDHPGSFVGCGGHRDRDGRGSLDGGGMGGKKKKFLKKKSKLGFATQMQGGTGPGFGRGQQLSSFSRSFDSSAVCGHHFGIVYPSSVPVFHHGMACHGATSSCISQSP